MARVARERSSTGIYHVMFRGINRQTIFEDEEDLNGGDIKVKSYIIRIELEKSNPLIWRRVIMPAGATFNRLHDVIQNVTNFQSGYPSSGYHLFEFDLTEENMLVTNDEQAYLEHQHYKKNKAMYEERLKTIPPEMIVFEKNYQERLKIEVRKPTGLKIDDSLEKYKEIRYNYDFGDDWHFTVKLEEIVDDYYFGFPTLLDGVETAPPEDVGGIHGFYEFLKAYRDPKHPEYEDIKTWAESLYFREYDPDWINERLKGINYKKTEWDNINHERYNIIEDKYRKK
ncbi:plasmid pRiA4b ORF-3 family protein [Alkaliphilus metalliredigens QYMF]|uniref:Plasmid pRiA4b ORF-3 family protein n=1 Tax=Alkaliphilus metalliredigens (strain QYMF) TaxID=293826 RepID=A6TJU9_ALKMQ|nr:plasmid pRiA4b ORF-3 family protein [Alkaliphilus metalliredigens]ABR46467.1 plasmid pRiA4b ORF-3 family protein [Alkaliphilus metalliredigens QYMF]